MLSDDDTVGSKHVAASTKSKVVLTVLNLQLKIITSQNHYLI